MAMITHPTKEKNSAFGQIMATGFNRPVMMTGKALTLVVIMILAGIHGCVDIVTDIDFPETEPKIVVHSFISPSDTAVQVMVSWSNPVSLGTSQESIRLIDHATVRIAEKNQPGVVVPYYPEKNVYALSTNLFPITAGNHYTLRVYVDGYESVTGVCYVPFPNNTLQIDRYEVENFDWSELIQLDYSFSDIPGQHENFYAPAAYLDELRYMVEQDTIGTGKRKFQTISGESYISNKGREGRRFVMRAEAYNYRYHWLEGPSEDEIETSNVYLLLLATDEHYYHYHKTLENYFPDNPFAEPVLIYSNIEGGLGVFAGYNRYEIVIDLNTSSP